MAKFNMQNAILAAIVAFFVVKMLDKGLTKKMTSDRITRVGANG